MAYGYRQAETLVRRELIVQHTLAKSGKAEVLHVPLILGPVGGGKTAMSGSLIADFGYPIREINSGENSDVTDVSGVPVPSMVQKLMVEGTAGEKIEARGEYMKWVLNRFAAEACATPIGLLFDDFDKAPPPVQGACLGIAGKRRFRDQCLHPETLIIAAGNRVGDDLYANQVSESIRTRMTIIEMEPDVPSFVAYGVETGQIHEIVLGFLQYKPEFLHQWKDAVSRFPTPRGWKEASDQLKMFPEPFEDVLKDGSKSNWKIIVSLKCGDHVANDFWAWFKIISKIDVRRVLVEGKLPELAKASDKRATEYAAIFAIAQELNNRGVKKEYVGLEDLLDPKKKELGSEMRMALLSQLSTRTRTAIAKEFEKAADHLMSSLAPAPVQQQP